MKNDAEEESKIVIENSGGDSVSDSITNILKEGILRAFTEKVQRGEIAIEDLEQRIQKFLGGECVAELFMTMTEEISSDSVGTIESIMYEKVLEERAFSDEFLARQNQKWGKAFVASEALYLCVLESTEHYVAHVVKEHEGEVNYVYCALKYIHARALQIYSEIMCLIQNGFADGAYARWRSLYELSVVASFIKKYGSQVAEEYVKSSGSKVRNEWARSASCFRGKKKSSKISFKDLFDNSDINEAWNKEYQFTNLLVHGSSDGTFGRLGTYGNAQVMSVGRSDWGMSISAIHAAVSLIVITTEFFTVYTHGDSIVAAMTFYKWISRIESFYTEVEENCFPKDIDTLPMDVQTHGVIKLG